MSLFDPDVASLFNLLIEERKERLALEERLKLVEIRTGLRFGDPHELGEIGMQTSHVEYEYEAFKRDNPNQP
jgi:hypothetical protein